MIRQQKFLEIQQQLGSAVIAVEEGFNSSHDKEQLLTSLTNAGEMLKKARVRDDLKEKKTELQEQLVGTIEQVSESKNYKINQVNSGVDKKSKKILAIISNILSAKLAKPLVDDIIEEIVSALNRK